MGVLTLEFPRTDAVHDMDGLRFITAKSLRKEIHSDEEFSLPCEYDKFIVPDLRRMDAIYGKLGNFAHPSIESGRAQMAKSVVRECFQFLELYQPIFHRHVLEKCATDKNSPPSDLEGLLFVVGATDDGKDIFIRCEGAQWIDRSPT